MNIVYVAGLVKNRWRKFQGHDVTAATLLASQVRVVSLPPTEYMAVTCDKQYASLKFCFRLKKSSDEAYMILQEAYGEVFPNL